MSNFAFQLIHSYEAISCCNCGMGFAVEAAVRQRWQRKGTGFYCPAGHYQSYKETDVQKLEKQLAREKADKEWHMRNAANERAARERTQKQLAAEKGAKTRLQNRIKNGVCPCCTRTFLNLQNHMKTQHPEFTPGQS